MLCRSRSLTLVMAGVLAVLLLPTHAAVPTAPGDLDTRFGKRGKVVTAQAGRSLHGFRTLVQPDGKILVAASWAEPRSSRSALVVYRYLSNGKLDTRFGQRGSAEVMTAPMATPAGLRLLGDGSILAAGTVAIGFDGEWVVGKFTPDGRRDATFGTAGFYTTLGANAVGPGFDRLAGLEVESTGRIVLAGTREDSMAGSRLYVLKLTAAGARDETFGDAGVRTYNLGEGAGTLVNATAPGPGDSLYVGADIDGGSMQYFGVVAKLTTAGDLDPGFNGTGQVYLGFNNSVRSFAPFAGGLVTGGVRFDPMSGSQDFLVTRGFDNGSGDPAFGNGGIAVVPLSQENDILTGVAIQPDGKILGAGIQVVGSEEDLVLARFTQTGVLDATFGLDGVVRLNVGRTGRNRSHDGAYGIAIQADQKILTTGRTSAGSRTPEVTKLLLARFLP